MSEAVAELLKGYRALSDDERDLFDANVHAEECDFDPAFRAELDRRIEAVGNGTAVLLDGEECFRDIREGLRQKRETNAP